MKNRLFATLFIGLVSSFIFAQDFEKEKLDSYFDTIAANDKFMGSVAVSQNGKIIYTKSIGYSDVENEVKADKNTKYRIGSISKTFTSVLVLKAVEEKKLDLDKTIEGYFPTVKNAEKITIRNLLNHRSGIFNFTSDTTYLKYNTQAKTEKEMIEIIAEFDSNFEPDSTSEYSNSNFVLLTFILERTYKKSYSELITKYITKPIGLKNTFVGSKINSKNNEAQSYRRFENWKIETETDMSVPLGAGAIVSTPTDLVKFSDALFNGKILTPESLELMKKINGDFGMGLFEIPFDDKIGYGHTGGVDNFSSIFTHFSDGNISYALISNGTNMNNNNISIAVMNAVFKKPFDIPNFEVYQLTSEELDQYTGIYSSPEAPIEITIAKDVNILTIQVTGQPAFPLEATEKDIFKFDQLGVVLEFDLTKNEMILKQGGGEFRFTKE